MQLLRLAILIFLVLVGGAGLLIGAVVTFSSISTGTVILTYVANGTAVAETVLRATDAGRFWQLVGLMGALPMLLGAAALWYGLRRLRS